MDQKAWPNTVDGKMFGEWINDTLSITLKHCIITTEQNYRTKHEEQFIWMHKHPCQLKQNYKWDPQESLVESLSDCHKNKSWSEFGKQINRKFQMNRTLEVINGGLVKDAAGSGTTETTYLCTHYSAKNSRKTRLRPTVRLAEMSPSPCIDASVYRQGFGF